MFQVNNIFILVLLIVLMGSIKLQTDIKKNTCTHSHSLSFGCDWCCTEANSVLQKFKAPVSPIFFSLSLTLCPNRFQSSNTFVLCVFCCVGKFNYSCELTIPRMLNISHLVGPLLLHILCIGYFFFALSVIFFSASLSGLSSTPCCGI